LRNYDRLPNPSALLSFSDLLPRRISHRFVQRSDAGLHAGPVEQLPHRPDPAAFLDNLSLAFTKLRAAGLKAVLRFQYMKLAGKMPLKIKSSRTSSTQTDLRQNSH